MNLVKTLVAPFVLTWKSAVLMHRVCKGTFYAARWAYRLVRGHEKASAYGDATFADEKELRAYSGQGFLVGISKKGRRIRLDHETSVVNFGVRGVGKTQEIVANLKSLGDLQVKPDLIIADPVGDIERSVSKDLQSLGFETFRVDLTDALKSHKYDPLSFLDPNKPLDFASDVMTFCTLLIPEDPHPNSASMHFVSSARSMLQSMVMQRAQNSSLYELIVRLTVEKKLRVKDFAQIESGIGHVLMKQGVETFNAAGDREKGSMDSTLSLKLRAWLDDRIRIVTTMAKGQKSWRFEDMYADKKPVCMFVRSGLGNEFGGHLVRLVVGNAINTRRRMWNGIVVPDGHTPQATVDRTFPKPLWIFVDEAKAMGNCEAVIDAVNELRKAKVSTYLAFLTHSDVKQVYGSAHSLLNGCAWVLHGGSRDTELYRQVEQLAGTKTVKSKSQTKGAYDSESESETGRSLATVADLQKLPGDELVVVAPRLLAKLGKPFKVEKGGVRYP